MEKKEGKKTGTHGSAFESFFLDCLKDIYWAEKHIVKSLNKMAREATTKELRTIFEEHKEVSSEQVLRLEKIFEMLEKKAVGKKCDAVEGITKEIEETIAKTGDDTYTRDVALILGAQKIEHYEIATYGSLIQFARVLNEENIAELLMQTLDEAKDTDGLLTSIAENYINVEATVE